jgi:hypothetical protein
LAEIDAALQQDPLAPLWFRAVRGGILFDMKDYAGSLHELRRLPYQNVHILMHQVAALALKGESVAAEASLNEMRQLMPDVSLAVAAIIHPYGHQETLDHLLEGLRLAGVPET